MCPAVESWSCFSVAGADGPPESQPDKGAIRPAAQASATIKTRFLMMRSPEVAGAILVTWTDADPTGETAVNRWHFRSGAGIHLGEEDAWTRGKRDRTAWRRERDARLDEIEI